MQTFSRKLYTFACRFIQIFSLILTSLLFLGAFLTTCYSKDMVSQLVLTRFDNPLLNLLGMALFSGFLVVLCRLFQKRRVRVLTILVLAWCLIIGAVLIVFSKTVPAADAMSVYSIAEALAGGDTSVIHPADSYLSYYPQQVGLTAFFELLIRLCKLLPGNLPAYHFIKCLYVLMACIIILFQEKTVHLLWGNETADCIYLLLAGANLPFLMYTSFVYGEIPSFTAVTLGFYLLAGLCKGEMYSKRRKILLSVGALLFLSLAVMLRKNNLILIIAVLIVTFLQWIKVRKPLLLIWGVICGLCCFSILPAIQKCYELRAGTYLKSGVTATSYFAMGMQESSRANGWYNGFNFYTYQETGMDSKATNAISKEAIRERLNTFREDPKYTVRFYLGKHLSQWADGTYASRQATLATFGGRSPFFVSLYEGNASRYFIEYCNIYQNMLYLGSLFFCLTAFRKKQDSLPLYLGIIGMIGGFLFHIIWEANSRYILLYGLLLMPYAAQGLAVLGNSVFTGLTRHDKILGRSRFNSTVLSNTISNKKDTKRK